MSGLSLQRLDRRTKAVLGLALGLVVFYVVYFAATGATISSGYTAAVRQYIALQGAPKHVAHSATATDCRPHAPAAEANGSAVLDCVVGVGGTKLVSCFAFDASSVSASPAELVRFPGCRSVRWNSVTGRLTRGDPREGAFDSYLLGQGVPEEVVQRSQVVACVPDRSELIARDTAFIVNGDVVYRCNLRVQGGPHTACISTYHGTLDRSPSTLAAYPGCQNLIWNPSTKTFLRGSRHESAVKRYLASLGYSTQALRSITVPQCSKTPRHTNAGRISACVLDVRGTQVSVCFSFDRSGDVEAGPDAVPTTRSCDHVRLLAAEGGVELDYAAAIRRALARRLHPVPRGVVEGTCRPTSPGARYLVGRPRYDGHPIFLCPLSLGSQEYRTCFAFAGDRVAATPVVVGASPGCVPFDISVVPFTRVDPHEQEIRNYLIEAGLRRQAMTLVVPRCATSSVPGRYRGYRIWFCDLREGAQTIDDTCFALAYGQVIADPGVLAERPRCATVPWLGSLRRGM